MQRTFSTLIAIAAASLLASAATAQEVRIDLGVFDIDKKNGGMTLKELAPGVTLDEIKSKTEASYKVPNTL